MTLTDFQEASANFACIKKCRKKGSNGGVPRFRRAAYAISAAYRMQMKMRRHTRNSLTTTKSACRLARLPSIASDSSEPIPSAKIRVRARTKRLFISVARMCAAARRLRLPHAAAVPSSTHAQPIPTNMSATATTATSTTAGGTRASTKALLQSFRQFRVGASVAAPLPTLVVKPSGGLCNKLRVTFSFFLHCRKNHIPLTVIWLVTAACPGFFLDYFKPLPGVAFVRRQMPYHVEDDIVLGNSWHPLYDPHVTFIYQGLALLPHMEDMLNARIAELGERYVAVHVRRTDHIALAASRGCFTSDEEFVNFLSSPVNQSMNIYLATDNGASQDFFKKLYPKRIRGLVPMDEAADAAGALRLTTLEESVLDLFMCVRAAHFKGSGYSSFSGTIMQMRNMEHLRVKTSRFA